MKLTRQGRDALRFIAKTLVSSGTKPYQATATVISTNGTTATVRIDGADTTTPATLGVDVKPGDRVQVRVANSGVVVQGNNSAPPTDDAEALAAKVRAQLAQESAVTAQEAADTAQETADAAAERVEEVAASVKNYVWSDDSGLHVTQIEGEVVSGESNVLLDSDSLDIRVGNDMLASYGASGFQIGRSGESHLTGDYHSLQLVNKEGEAYFYVSDLRDRTGTASVEDVFTADGTTRMFFLAVPANSTDYTVTVSDGSGGTVSKSHSIVSFSTAPTAGASITVDYVTEDPGATAFTYGSRDPSETVGLGSAVLGFGAYASDFAALAEGYQTGAGRRYSHAEGIGSTASGISSHAEGGYTEASGTDSHAEGRGTRASGGAAHAEGSVTRASGTDSHAEGIGSQAKSTASHAQNYYTIAASDKQTAIGKYNVEDSNDVYVFIIGNGTASNRSNALTVDWSGNVELAGSVKPGNTTAGRAVITDANGKLATSSVTSTELYRLSGITSNVQNQLDSAKTTAAVQHVTATLTATIAANGSASGTLQATIPTGYAPVSVMCSALSNAFLMDIRVLSVDTSGLITYYIRNTSTSSAITNGTATFNVACVKTS